MKCHVKFTALNFSAAPMEDALIKNGFVTMMMIVGMVLMRFHARIRRAILSSSPVLVVIVSICNGNVMVKSIVKMAQMKSVCICFHTFFYTYTFLLWPVFL